MYSMLDVYLQILRLAAYKCCACAVCWMFMCRCSRDGTCRLLWLLCMRHVAAGCLHQLQDSGSVQRSNDAQRTA
jgi:hypothetical protein